LASTFGLTSDERKIVMLILVLALLGLGAKAWHHHRLSAAGQDAPEQAETP
jgi:hypothetical protein